MTVDHVLDLAEMSKESLVDLAHELETQLEDLHEDAATVQAARPVERYADWYKRMHASAGSDPDLHVACEQVRILA